MWRTVFLKGEFLPVKTLIRLLISWDSAVIEKNDKILSSLKVLLLFRWKKFCRCNGRKLRKRNVWKKNGTEYWNKLVEFLQHDEMIFSAMNHKVILNSTRYLQMLQKSQCEALMSFRPSIHPSACLFCWTVELIWTNLN